MNSFFYLKLALQNLKKHAKLVVPYILTGALFVMMFYVILALSTHSDFYGRERGTLLSLGVVVIGVFAVIFLFYTNSFLIRQRRSELGLYNILGMEKKHLARTLFYETVIMGAVSIVSGILCGTLFGQGIFLLLYKMVNELPQMNFEISTLSLKWTVILFGCIYFATTIFNVSQIHLAKPIDLLRSKNEGEKEPKTKWLMALLGLFALGGGYYLAVSITNPIDAMVYFFVAVILVIIGTYLLFTAGSIVFLKMLRKNKKYYYQTSHFVSVSNMIYRMKQNAVGLANICILSTMVLVMVSSTGSLFLGVEDAVYVNAPYEVNMSFSSEDYEITQQVDQRIMQDVQKHNLDKVLRTYNFSCALDFEDGKWHVANGNDSSFKDIYYVYISTDNSVELAENEAAVLFSDGSKIDGFWIGDEYYTAKEGEEFKNADSMFQYNPGFKSLVYIGLKNEKIVNDFVSDLKKYINEEESRYIMKPGYSYGFNGDYDEQELESFQKIHENAVHDVTKSAYENSEYTGSYSYAFTSQKEVRTTLMDFFGSFFFVGLFLSVLFIIATTLTMYYKQISEGHDDVKRYQILQKVGMDHSEVKKSIHAQILIVFFMPLVTAGIHVMFAFNMIYRLFSVFGMCNEAMLATVTGIVFVIFSVFYFIIYQLTAKVYYKIVS